MGNNDELNPLKKETDYYIKSARYSKGELDRMGVVMHKYDDEHAEQELETSSVKTKTIPEELLEGVEQLLKMFEEDFGKDETEDKDDSIDKESYHYNHGVSRDEVEAILDKYKVSNNDQLDDEEEDEETVWYVRENVSTNIPSTVVLDEDLHNAEICGTKEEALNLFYQSLIQHVIKAVEISLEVECKLPFEVNTKLIMGARDGNITNFDDMRHYILDLTGDDLLFSSAYICDSSGYVALMHEQKLGTGDNPVILYTLYSYEFGWVPADSAYEVTDYYI